MIAPQPDLHAENDLLCIQRTLDGDRDGFEALVDRYGKMIYALAYRMLSDPDDAEEAVQEIFLRTYSALDSFRIGQRFHPWLYTIAVNYLRSVVRKRTTRRRDLELPYEDEIGVDIGGEGYESPESAAMRKETGAAIQRALKGLRPKYREAFVLFEISGLSIKDIAEILDLSDNTVKTRLRRARLALADTLADEGWP